MQLLRSVRRRLASAVPWMPAPPDPERKRVAITVRLEACGGDEGGYVASIVGIPDVHSRGDTEREAVQNVLDALASVVQREYSDSDLEIEHVGTDTHRVLLPV